MAYLNGRKILNAKVEIVDGYDEGYAQGKTDGYNQGYEHGYGQGGREGYRNGQQAEYDAFWDVYQGNIAGRGGYAYSFYGGGWTPATFKPKYDFDCGTNSYAMFSWSYIEEIEKTIDARNCTNFTQVFWNAQKLKTVTLLKVSEKTTFSNTFGYCTALENITFEGEICNDINLQWSTKLSAESVHSIVMHLKIYNPYADEDVYGKKILTVPSQAWQRLVDSDLMDELIYTSFATWENYIGYCGWNLVLT